MSTLDKLIKKVFAETTISYDDAERILLALDFNIKISSSHHIFRKMGHLPVVLKRRPPTSFLSNKNFTRGITESWL